MILRYTVFGLIIGFGYVQIGWSQGTDAFLADFLRKHSSSQADVDRIVNLTLVSDRGLGDPTFFRTQIESLGKGAKLDAQTTGKLYLALASQADRAAQKRIDGAGQWGLKVNDFADAADKAADDMDGRDPKPFLTSVASHLKKQAPKLSDEQAMTLARLAKVRSDYAHVKNRGSQPGFGESFFGREKTDEVGRFSNHFACLDAIKNLSYGDAEAGSRYLERVRKEGGLEPTHTLAIPNSSNPGEWIFVTPKGAYRQQFKVDNPYKVDPSQQDPDDSWWYGSAKSYELNIEDKPPLYVRFRFGWPKSQPENRKEQVEFWYSPRPNANMKKNSPGEVKDTENVASELVRDMNARIGSISSHYRTWGHANGRGVYESALSVCEQIPELKSSSARVRKDISPSPLQNNANAEK